MTVDRARAAPLSTTRAGSAWLAPGVIFIGCCLLYLINLERAPHPDELYHMLAARGLLEHGEPRIAEGLYTRVFAYTWLVAQSFALLGESLTAARLPSVLAMASVATILFTWLRREAGSLAAWVATGLFVLSPFAVDIAQFARFYALQILFFLIGGLALYELARQPLPITSRVILLAVAAMASLAFAIYTQPTTLFGLAAIGAWLGTAIGVPWLAGQGAPRRHKVQAIALATLGGVLLLGAAWATGIFDAVWQTYRQAQLFNIENADAFWYYHVFYLLFYPTLWPLIGILSLAGLAFRPRAAWFAIVVFAISFLLNSFAGPKNLRYIAYAQPFLFIVFGLGIAALLPWIRQAGHALVRQFEQQLTSLGVAARPLIGLLLGGSLLALLVGNAAFLRTATIFADITVPPQQPNTQWEAARPAVMPLLNDVDVVITMAELETLYFWERYDILFSPSRLSELQDTAQFTPDHRTGRPVISTQDALARVVACTPTGLFVSPAGRWRLPHLVDAETVTFIEQEMTRLELPGSMQLVVFVWDHSPDADCPAAIEQGREAGE